MYSILLIDDEKSIRDYLPKAIPFEQYGFTVKDTAINGKEALKKLPEAKPDLIILDIRMPEMDGLQFLKALRQSQFANTLVIMLSGYNDFTYAKESMKYGVKAYLLKPVDEDELLPLLEKMREELDKSRNERIIGDIRGKLKLLNKLYSGGTVDRSQFKGFSFMTCVLLPCQESFENTNPHVLMQECLASQLGEIENCLFRAKGSMYTYLLSPHMLASFNNSKKALADSLLKAFKKYNLNCSLLFNSYVFEHEDKSFREDFANQQYEMMTELFFNPREYMDYHPELLKMETELPNKCKYLEDIRNHFQLLSREDIHKDMEALFNEIARVRLGIQYIQEISYRIFYIISDEISKLTDARQGEPFLTRPEWLEYQYFTLFPKWKEWQLALIIRGLEFIERSCRMTKMGISKGVIEYIHLHYKEQIRLKDVAEKFFVNAAYLGRAFQKATGVNFNQYLNDLRIAEAKKLLLQTDKLIYEIANEVGYTESKYFIMKFTQSVGKSPTEYRNQP
ncbi:MAG: response regulator [Clostridiaceae bacterium]|nr:response regulator [Clostridiaceae bacterium]